MCSEAIADEHQHVVNVAARQLMCVCRGCYLLFTDSHAQLRYRAVPDRYLSFPDFALDRARWEACRSRSAWRSSFATRRWIVRSRSIRDRRVPPNPNWTSTSGTRSAQPTPGWHCSPTTSRRCSCECAKTINPFVFWSRSMPATSSLAGSGCCGVASTVARTRVSTSTNSSSALTERSEERRP